ncbi:unnamed protein product [Phytomonas sp. Hart1]|nr:unnamed protein product [Phytomonas sp. Hart1]|eukprot:CCW65928.1 unnamed protein product [Phytomonas sp. isolate Hart1]
MSTCVGFPSLSGDPTGLVNLSAGAADPELASSSSKEDRPRPGDEEACEPGFFEDAGLCEDLLRRLGSELPADKTVLLPSVGQEPDGVAGLVERFAKVLDRYQENPYLLHPYLEGMVGPLVGLVLRYLPPATEGWGGLDVLGQTEPWDPNLGRDHAKDSAQQACTDRGVNCSHEDALLLEPNALGQNFDMFDMDAPKTPLHLVCRALYALVKTAGEKNTTSHFPSEVRYYEDVFYALQLWKADPLRLREWEVRYCLLLWLSNLILVPFDLNSIDSKQLTASHGNPPCGEGDSPGEGGSLSDAVLTTAISFLGDASKCREGAALVIARLLTRPDSHRHRRVFFSYAQAILTAGLPQPDPLSTPSELGLTIPEGAFLRRLLVEPPPGIGGATSRPTVGEVRGLNVPGVLLAVAKTLKLGQRLEMLPYTAALLSSVGRLFGHHRGDSLWCKTAMKVGQRLCLCMLRNRLASWRYHRRDITSLAANLGEKAHSEGGGGPPDGDFTSDDVDAIEGDAAALEEGIGLLLEGLGHKDTVVRWSAAKGIGRVCERLPADFSNEVVLSVYDVFAAVDRDAHWHGGLLALAELCRRGLVDPSCLPRAVGFIREGLSFDLSKGTYSVGAHVRDAACYACWSIPRAYDAADVEPHVRTLSTHLVATALFDREVNVRRAAAAAFQECVGRLGSFPSGILLVTLMDFFSLASLKNAYGGVAPQIATHDTYRPRMLEVLMGAKVNHWDRAVRQCAATALGEIVLLEDYSTFEDVLTELHGRVVDPLLATRHGAVLALSGIVRKRPREAWSSRQCEEIAQVLGRLDAGHFFRSRGGEYLRQAVCQLLQACAESGLPLPEFVSVTKLSGERGKARTLAKIQEFLEDSWRNILVWVQDAAAEAFHVIARAYYTEFQPKFHGKVMEKILETCSTEKGHPLERRGFLAGLGGLPLSLLTASRPNSNSSFQAAPYYVSVLEVLCEVVRGTRAGLSDPELDDVEARRNAVQSLGRVMTTLQPDVDIGMARYRQVVEVLLAALHDYAVDKRGDVGSFVRLEALNALPAVVFAGLSRTLSQGSPPWCDASLLGRVLQNIIRVMMEKLDRVRGVALATLIRLFGSPETPPPVDLVDAIDSNKLGIADEAVVSETRVVQRLVMRAQRENWTSPQEVLIPFGVELLQRCPTLYAQSTMEGLVLSAGDLSAHVSGPGLEALLLSFGPASDDAHEERRHRLSASLIEVATTHSHVERVLVPLSRVLNSLLNAGVFSDIQHSALITILRQEFKHFATTITVLFVLVSLLGNLCHIADSVSRNDAWSLALVVIASRYPKVRSKMATEFYTALLVWTSTVWSLSDADSTLDVGKERDSCLRAMKHLLSTQWDGAEANKVRQARNALCEMLGIPSLAPVGLAKCETNTKPLRREIVAGTYFDLVHEAGY